MAAPSSKSSSNAQSVGNDTVIKINSHSSETEITSTKSLPDSFINNVKNSDFVTESPAAPRSPKDVRVFFSENLRRRYSGSNHSGGSGFGEREEVVACNSNKWFNRDSQLMRMKSKSRLLDPPEQDSKAKNLMKSGYIGQGSEFDDDDPFLEEDFPEEFKKRNFSNWAVIQLSMLILIITALVCSLFVNFFEKNRMFGLELWKWGLLLLVLICGRLVAGWGIRVVVFFIELNLMLRKRVLYFVYGLRNAVKNCIWLALVLIAWRSILVERVANLAHGKVLSYVTRTWVCLLVGTLIWLAKTLLVKVLASSFHVSTFFDRIQDALFSQYVIETLSGPPIIEIQQAREEEEQIMSETAGANVPCELRSNGFPRSGKLNGTTKSPGYLTTGKSFTSVKSSRFSTVLAVKENEGITINHLHRLNQKNISAWNMKRLINIVRKSTLTTLDEQIQGFTGEDETALQIRSEIQAKQAAKKIFCNVAKPGSKHIYQDDLMQFMRDDEAVKTISLFEEASETRGISRRALKNWVVCAFRERRALAFSLNDTKTAVNKLQRMLDIFVGILIVIVWLLILKVASIQFFVFLSSQLILVAFVFGNTCKAMFEGIVFLFVMHPFDIGDRCEVDGIQLIVEEMNILTTIFLRYDNQKISYPNSVLATKPISNYYRSPDMGDAIDFCIHISTPVEKIGTMKEKITSYIEKKSDHWHPAPLIVLRDMEDLNRLKISLWPSHRMNFQDMGERWVRRALLVEEMIKIFRELDIEYRMLPLDMNVRNMPATVSNRLPSNWTSCAD
ncbi:mechanosensitive ion channel protein 6-like [Apium graveolens]|uniref:mechanosensitive ion channel protein 6-like n=1 Tax=Apium graveolens TaxID=4045 RepID=UPI003D78C16B